MTLRRFFLHFFGLAFLFSPPALLAQNLPAARQVGSGSFEGRHKGDLTISWGWNRGHYSNSDLHFKGTDYDFVLHDVVAKDRQSDFSLNTYLNPVTLTIPQTNFKVGYYISDHYYISIGWDHMKYVMEPDQTVIIDGYIDLEENIYNNIYENEEIVLDDAFLSFEHTDGLNYMNIGLSRSDDLVQIEKLRMVISTTAGVSAGILYPKSNTALLGKERYDQFHVAGYGTDLRAGLNLEFFKYLFFQGEINTGYINMPNIRTTLSTADKASQHFFFVESIISFGVVIPLKKKELQ